MSKIVNITSKEDKDQKLQDIANSLEELKDVMAEVIEAYEEENADSRKMPCGYTPHTWGRSFCG